MNDKAASHTRKRRSMNLKKWLTAALLAVTASSSTAGLASAKPESPSLTTQLAPVVTYKAYQDGATAVISVASGSLLVDHGRFEIRSATGKVVAGVPLSFNVGDIAFPIEAKVAGATAWLTPKLDRSRATYRPVALPYQKDAPWKSRYDREQAAWNRMSSTIVTGAAVGAIVGAVSAGALGCLLGGVSGAVVTAPLFLLLGGGPVAGCLVGATMLAPVGTLVGSIFVGAPVAIASVIQYQDTVNAPFKPPAPAK